MNPITGYQKQKGTILLATFLVMIMVFTGCNSSAAPAPAPKEGHLLALEGLVVTTTMYHDQVVPPLYVVSESETKWAFGKANTLGVMPLVPDGPIIAPPCL